MGHDRRRRWPGGYCEYPSISASWMERRALSGAALMRKSGAAGRIRRGLLLHPWVP